MMHNAKYLQMHIKILGQARFGFHGNEYMSSKLYLFKETNILNSTKASVTCLSVF